MRRRQVKSFLRWLPAALLAALLAVPAAASAQPASTDSGQAYPVKPVRIITAAAGGGSDFATRLIAAPLGTALGHQVIVDNRGLLAADIAAKAPADGYTLLLSGQTLWLLPFMRDKVASDVSDFAPVTLATETANILVVHPTLPAKSTRDLLALARSRPGQLNYATSGVGNSVHLAAELFKYLTKADIVRVNYKAASQALTDLIAGQTQFMFAVPGSSLPHVRAGRLRALAVTSAKPTPLAPELPTVSQALPGYESVSRLAIFAPAGTPPAIVGRLNQEITRLLARPEVKDRFFAASMETVGGTPEALAALVKSETDKLGKVIKAAGIRAD
jgi:tripartite-type tricarboxylate transporter receptor subunit TctC